MSYTAAKAGQLDARALLPELVGSYPDRMNLNSERLG